MGSFVTEKFLKHIERFPDIIIVSKLPISHLIQLELGITKKFIKLSIKKEYIGYFWFGFARFVTKNFPKHIERFPKIIIVSKLPISHPIQLDLGNTKFVMITGRGKQK